MEQDTAIVVLPIMNAKTNYRDVDPGMPCAQDVWDPLWLAPVLGAPEISVPGKLSHLLQRRRRIRLVANGILVGSIGYTSRVTQRAESLPVAVSVMSPPGTDMMLISALRDAFVRSVRPLAVRTGREMY